MKRLRAYLVFTLLIFVSGTALAGTEKTAQIDGKAIRIWTEGLESRQAGQPVLIFENGATSSIESWGDFPSRAANLAPVVLYDRATVGKSEWDGKVGTPAHVTSRLWALLRNLEIEPPYVLIGWSWGGDLVLHHAQNHEADVVGVVLIDPPLHSAKSELEVLNELGLGESAHETNIRRMTAEMATISDALRADVSPILTIFKRREDPSHALPPRIRIAALVAGKRNDPRAEDIKNFGAFPYDFQQFVRARTLHRTRRLTNLAFASEHGLLIVLPDARHPLHRDKPDLVLEAINHVLPDAVRK